MRIHGERRTMKDELFYGRLVTWPKSREIPDGAQVFPSILHGGCGRCGGRKRAKLPSGHSYCLDCLELGRVSTLDVLLTRAEPNDFVKENKMRWAGQLTRKQAVVSRQLCQNFQEGADQLLWAVTGAGKTEMIFSLLNDALSRAKRVGIVSPRVDVVLELAPRIKEAFKVTVEVLYGDQEKPYQYSQLVVGTVHQLLRFYRAFDLLIIDEVDAFPFRGNQLLARAVKQSVKLGGQMVMLTATPLKSDLRKLKKKGGRLLILPRRFHQHPLPEITVEYDPRWQSRMSKRLKNVVLDFEERQVPFFIFVPKVRHLSTVSKQLMAISAAKGTTVHANDPERITKVKAMREGCYDYLISTTILERGVTLPKLQVVILGADDPTFSKESLLQMAGRVGRSKDASDGLVLAVASGPSASIQAAKTTIKRLNQQAKEGG